MKKQTLHTLVITLAATALVACSESPRTAGGDGNGSGTTGNNGGDNGGDNGGNNGGQADQLCSDFQSKFRGLLVRSLGGQESDYEQFLSIDCDEWSANAAAGKFILNSAKANECLTAVENLDCATSNPFAGDNGPDPSCDEVFVGTVMIGGECNDDDVCMPQSRCEQEEDNCPGTCVALAVAGEACDYFGSDTCADGLVCMRTGTSTAGACAARKTAGEMCEGGDCVDGLSCGEMSVCVGPKAVGETCSDEDECAGFARCAGEPGSATCQLVTKVGEACDMTTVCAWGPCGMDGKCPAGAGVGDVCGVVEGSYVLCLSGYCNATSFEEPGECVALLADGSSCESSQQCAIGECTDNMCGLPICD